MVQIRPKRKWLRFVIVLLALLVVPYLFSRLMSPWRQLVVRTAGAASARTQDRADSLRIVTYNIAHGRGVADSNWDGGDDETRLSRLDDIADLLRSIDANLVVLNEVDFDSSWSHSTNQAEYIAEKAGYPYWVEQRNLDFRVLTWTWRFGNAILSKHPITEAVVVDLPGYSRWETLLAGKKRSVMCEINDGDHSVRLIGAHLSHRSEQLRVESAGFLCDLVTTSGPPTIIAGDLNSTPPSFPQSASAPDGSNAIATFDASSLFQRMPSAQPDARSFTFHTKAPRQVIDWILIPPTWHFHDYRADAAELSDHRLVYAEVKLSERQ